MDRRHFLAAAAGASTLPLAGCLGSSELDWKRLPDEDLGGLVFYESGTRTAAFSVTERRIEPENGRFGLALNLWHREDTHLDSLRYELRAPSNPNGPQVAVWLERPGASPWPEMTFGKGRDLHTTIIDVPEVGSVGVGSLGIELRLEATEMPDTLPARLDLSFDLSHEDRLFETYTAESSLEFDLHRNPNAQS